MTLFCPVCEELNANSFIFDGEKIRSLGFSPIADTEGNFHLMKSPALICVEHILY